MSHHHTSAELQHLYEGDQSKLYSGIVNHHPNEESDARKRQLKRILMVTLWLTIITTIEVSMGLYAHLHEGVLSKVFLAIFFLGFTVFKAFLIVRVFMHLGDEKKTFVYAVLIPLLLFIWFITAFLSDGHFWLSMDNTQAHTRAEQVQNW